MGRVLWVPFWLKAEQSGIQRYQKHLATRTVNVLAGIHFDSEAGCCALLACPLNLPSAERGVSCAAASRRWPGHWVANSAVLLEEARRAAGDDLFRSRIHSTERGCSDHLPQLRWIPNLQSLPR